MGDPIDDQKRALRADLRERRTAMSPLSRSQAEEGIAERLRELIARLGARSVSCFLSTSAEPGTQLFLEQAMDAGIRVLLPVTRSDGLLDWAVAVPQAEHTTNTLGIPEPTGDLLGPIAVGDVDLMIIPAAAVDEKGMRLGWGMGYFDKTIGSMAQRPPVYAVVYDSEVLDTVPQERHDQAVDGVVTPSRILSFAAPRQG